MKIDPQVQFPVGTQTDAVQTFRKPAVPTLGAAETAGVRPASGEDTVSISSAHSDVQTLQAALTNVPDVRTNRVSALQQQISSRQYNPSSQKVADAIIADHGKGKSA